MLPKVWTLYKLNNKHEAIVENKHFYNPQYIIIITIITKH